MPKAGFISLGCPKNLVDSEVMMGILARNGYEFTPRAEEADVLVVNTCSFIAPAQKESIDTILEMAEYKKFGVAKKLIVAGCLVERYRGHDFDIKFFEDDISPMAAPGFPDDCDLLMINLICGTGKIPAPGSDTEAGIKKYCMSGKPLFLIHAGSAAFAEWEWWRRLTGLRWVRENDPEGIKPSVHPVKDYSVTIASSGHMVPELEGFSLENEEIYTKLEQTVPVEVLLETKTDGGSFPMAYILRNEWGGMVAGFLPGHGEKSFENRKMAHDIRTIMRFLLKAKPLD